jgi:hypothetical protein
MLSKLMTRLRALLNKPEMERELDSEVVAQSGPAQDSTLVFCAGGAADISRWWSGA